MATKTTIQYFVTAPNGEKLQKTVTYVNPAASDAALLSFVQGANSLTNNTFGEAYRINKVSLEAAAPVDGGEG